MSREEIQHLVMSMGSNLQAVIDCRIFYWKNILIFIIMLVFLINSLWIYSLYCWQMFLLKSLYYIWKPLLQSYLIHLKSIIIIYRARVIHVLSLTVHSKFSCWEQATRNLHTVLDRIKMAYLSVFSVLQGQYLSQRSPYRPGGQNRSWQLGPLKPSLHRQAPLMW